MDEPKRSLVKKLAEVMAAVERVAKTGHNNFHHYDYATEADITAAVRGEMASRGVMMIPNVENVEFQEVLTAGNKKERLCTARFLFTLVDGDTNERIEFRIIGQGQDAGDKGFYKAATGAVKYGLMKLFLIPTGDDPEADEKPSPRTSKPAHPATPTSAQIAALVKGFIGLGVTEAMLESRVGYPLSQLDAPDFAGLVKYGKEKRAMASVTPEQEARRIEQEKAEAGIAAEQAEARRKIDVRMAELAAQDAVTKPDAVARVKLFEGFVDKIRAAKSVDALILVGSEYASSGLSPGELKGLSRTYSDRMLVLQDAASMAKRTKRLEISDVPS